MDFNPADVKTVAPMKAPLLLIFAPNGHGKSSFIASIKKPFVLDTEKKFKSDNEAFIYEPKNFQGIVDCIKYYLDQPKLEFGAFCLDSLDWIEKAIHNKICTDFKVPIVNDDHCKALNFNKGFDLVANIFFADIYTNLDALRMKHNIPIIIGAQALSAKQKEADKEEFTMWDLRVHSKLAEKVSDLVEAKLYLQKREVLDSKGNRIPTEDRYLVTRRARGINAKNSLHLPETVEVTYSNGWANFISAIGTSKPAN